ncbi:50S ribosomal protein L14e [Candidatus Woesearchaeota archaeon]|nr:50S ribosomal protein L14e [Candidatus Woesearchaeota archaeon]
MAESNLIGRLCVKLSGREAGRECVIVEETEGNFVIIDGNVRRRKCNLDHLDISEKILKIKNNASTSDVQKAMKEEGIEVILRKEKKDNKPRLKKDRKKKVEEKSKKTNEPKKQRKNSK